MGLFFLRLKQASEKTEFLEYIKKQSYSHWISYCSGEYDLILSLHAKNKEEFEKIYVELNNRFPNVISSGEKIALEKQLKHMNMFLRETGNSDKTNKYNQNEAKP